MARSILGFTALALLIASTHETVLPKRDLENDQKLASTILTKLDPAVDPCVNFYDFACGGWIAAERAKDTEAEAEPTYEERVRDKLKNLLDSEDEPLPWSKKQRYRNVLKTFLKSCENKDGGTGDTAPAIVHDVQKMQVHLNQFQDDKPRLVAEIIAQAGIRAVTLFVGFAISRDPATGEMRLSAVKALPMSSDANEDELAQTNVTSALLPLMAYPNDNEPPESTKRKRDEADTSDPLTWQVLHWELISNVLSGVASTIDFHGVKAFEKLDQDLAARSSEEITEHAITEVTRQMMRRAKILAGMSCENAAAVHLPLLVLREMIDATTFPDAEAWRSQASETFQHIMGKVKDAVSTAEWMDLRTKEITLRKMENMYFGLAYPSTAPDFNDDDELFAMHDFEFNEDDFWTNCRMVSEHITKHELAKAGMHYNSYWSAGGANLHIENAIYSPVTNAIQIMYPLINFAEKVFERPESIRFSDTIAFGAAHEIGHSIDPFLLFYDGMTSVKGARSTKSAVVEKTQCLTSHFQEYTMNGVPLNPASMTRELIADNVGLYFAFETFRERAGDISEKSKLPGLEEYTEGQVFFMNFAQDHCSAETEEKWGETMLSGKKTHPPSPIRVNGALATNAGFRAVFECPEDSHYSSAPVCQYL